MVLIVAIVHTLLSPNKMKHFVGDPHQEQKNNPSNVLLISSLFVQTELDLKKVTCTYQFRWKKKN